MSFEPAKAKLTIGSLDDTGLTVSAQYNPKELQVDQSVPWKKQEPANNSGAAGSGGGGGGQQEKSIDNRMAIEFTGAEGRTMSVELLFDGVEPEGRYVNVTGQVAALQAMASVIDSESKDEKKRRPHHCVISWGQRGLPKFECVIESLSTKYSMFSTDGEPLRATCTVKLKEAKIVDKEKKGK
jgi:contractile injection system tube protein